MNTLIIFASVLAVALAAPGLAGLGAYAGQYAGPYAAQAYGGHYGAQAYGGYYGGHYTGPLASGLTVAPVGRLVDPAAIAAGAPLPTGDTVEVAHAKAAHFQAYATEAARNGAISYAAHATPLAYAHATPLAYNSGYAHASPLAYAHASPVAYAHGAYSEARLVDPVAIAAGAPLPVGDTVEVAHAKAAHFQAHAIARAGHLRYKRGLAYAASPLAYAAYAPRSYGYSSVTAHASPLAYGAHTAVAYNAPLVAAAHPVAHAYAAYAPQSYAAYAPHSYAYSSPISHYSSVW